MYLKRTYYNSKKTTDPFNRLHVVLLRETELERKSRAQATGRFPVAILFPTTRVYSNECTSLENTSKNKGTKIRME